MSTAPSAVSAAIRVMTRARYAGRSRRAAVHWLAAGILLALSHRRLQAQERHLYVADVAGAWQAVANGAQVDLAPLGRIPTTAMVRFIGDPADAASAFLVLRDPRTLGKARLRCDASLRCAQPTPVAQVHFERSAVAPGGTTGSLYATIGERERFRERLRLVGARGDDRGLAVVVLALDQGDLDLAPLVRDLGSSSTTGLIARMCALTGVDADECLDSRRALPSDCSLEGGRCAWRSAAGAFRVDLFAKERTMLSTVAVASGFAVVVDRAGYAAATERRNALVGPLLRARAEFSHDEWRALLAAAALQIAQDKP